MSEEAWRAAILEAQRRLLSLGLTAWQDAWVEPDVLAAYRALAASGELRAHVVACQWWERARGTDQIAGMVERRSASSVGTLRAGTVKIMQDGMPENFAAAVDEPYSRSVGSAAAMRSASTGRRRCGRRSSRSTPRVSTYTCTRSAIARSARRSRRSSPPSTRTADATRDTTSRTCSCSTPDVGRFRALDLVATVQPYWASADEQMTELTIPHLGHERSERQYAFRSLHAAGIRLAFASDWAITTADPLMGIESR